ncbi:MAG TPA: DinB family protein [Gemmatimonadales bacterium]|nr:DinB family protein [Gemmatimonadales bacterium]
MTRSPKTGVPDLRPTLLSAWRTTDRVTTDLVRQVPLALWRARVPGEPQRTVRAIAAHLHNARRGWIRTLGAPHGVAVPDRVDPHRVSRRELTAALRTSGRGIAALLELGLVAGGAVPPTRAYVWRNLPLDVGHILAYFVAHEAHHRGQIVLIARQLGQRLPRAAVDGLWQWSRIVKRRA